MTAANSELGPAGRPQESRDGEFVTSNYYGGHHVTQHGNYNVGMQHGDSNIGSMNGVPLTDQQRAVLHELIATVHVLRGQVYPEDRQRIDESLKVIENGANVERRNLRDTLTSLAGIATVVGQIGAPVVEAVRKVMEAFGP